MEDRITFTRRRMLALAGSAMAGAALAGCSKTGPEPAPSPSTPERLSLTVYDPTGAMEITQVFAPRLDTLEGKTVAFISDDEWEAHRMFPMIAEYLEKNYHCTTLDWQQFPYGIAVITREDSGIPDLLKAAGADAAIVGNAG